tara:strand:+ start:46 stop:291 length:246 start_codon:yes stop_codon:yes gene_type:complete
MKLKIHFRPLEFDVDRDHLMHIYKDEVSNNDTSYDFDEWLKKDGYEIALNDYLNFADTKFGNPVAHLLPITYVDITEEQAQ